MSAMGDLWFDGSELYCHTGSEWKMIKSPGFSLWDIIFDDDIFKVWEHRLKYHIVM